MRVAIVLLLTLPASAQMTAASFGSVFMYNSNYPTKYFNGDRHVTTQCANGTIYGTASDTYGPNNDVFGSGGRNLIVDSYDGYTTSLTATLVNSMDAFGQFTQTGSDGAAFKSYGITCKTVSGTDYLLLFVARDTYNHTTPPYIETVANAQLVKSTNSGSTFSPQPPSTAQPYASPTLPGTTFPTPMFVNYGQDGSCSGVDGCNTYAYLVSNEGCWNNCSTLIVARILWTAIVGTPTSSDFACYQGGDGSLDANWGSCATASPIISSSYHVSMAGMQYFPPCGCYYVPEWYYTGIPASFNIDSTIWDHYTCTHPWGPCTKFQSGSSGANGLYNPQPIPASVAGHTAVLTTTGDFLSQDLHTGQYTLQLTTGTFTFSDLPGVSGITGISFGGGMAIQ